MRAGGLEYLHRSEQTCRMCIVATGVHPTRNGAGMGAIHFLNGQCIHVRTEGDPAHSGVRTADFGHDAGRTSLRAPACGEGDPKPLQCFRHVSACARLTE